MTTQFHFKNVVFISVLKGKKKTFNSQGLCFSYMNIFIIIILEILSYDYHMYDKHLNFLV